MKRLVLGSIILILVVIFLRVILVYLGVPFNAFFNIWGNNTRHINTGIQEKTQNYQTILLKSINKSYSIDFEFKKGKSFKHPVFAAWIEDSIGNYIETLYISKSIAASTFQQVKYENKKWIPGVVRRPEALPCWSHSRNIKSEDGLYIPLHSASDLDAVTGATPKNNSIIKTGSSLKANINCFRILFELNQSFDWNDTYSENSYPKDSIYSGSGKVGQPSLIYSIDISKHKLNEKKSYLMKLIGHGHYSGKNGKIYSIIEGLSTALSIADHIKVSIYKNKN